MSSLPVTAGVYKEQLSTTPSLAFEAMFYKDDVFIGKVPYRDKNPEECVQVGRRLLEVTHETQRKTTRQFCMFGADP